MSITRVDYRERQRLTAADLRAEQQYRLGLGGRHHLAHHQWGVVRGLHVIVEPRRAVILTRGVAIDGYGREILVRSPVELAVRNGTRVSPLEVSGLSGRCLGVVLYYCESPAQVPPDRRCQDEPAPRIGQHFTWMVEDWDDIPLPPSSADDLARAQAAGRFPDLPPWPVLVARIGRGCAYEDDDPDFVPPLVDYSRTRYVRHRAGPFRSPSSRAALQLGLAGRRDVYHFALFTRDGGTAMIRRVAVDRDGDVQIWRPLVVTGDHAVGQAAISQNRILQIKTIMPAGIGRRVRIDAQLDPAALTLTASFRDTAVLRAVERPPLIGSARIQKTTRLLVPVRFGAARSATFALVTVEGKATPFVKPHGQPKAPGGAKPPAEPAVEEVSTELSPSGGRVVMERVRGSSDAPPVVECGDVDRARPAARTADLPVLQFVPAKDAKEIKSDPLAREVYAVTTSAPSDPVPRTELRLSGGAEDESDASSRLSIGFRGLDADGDLTVWIPALRMDGGRRIDLLSGTGAAISDALLRVEDTVYLPPIGKDDPLLPDLMAMAFISGLRQIGASLLATTATLTHVTPPAPPPNQLASIVRGGRLKYDLDVAYLANTQLKRCLEIITGIGGSGDLTFRTVLGITLPNGQASQKLSIDTPSFIHPASRVRVQIQMLVKRGTANGVVVSNALEFDVVDQ
jgi:hypothetical protein